MDRKKEDYPLLRKYTEDHRGWYLDPADPVPLENGMSDPHKNRYDWGPTFPGANGLRLQVIIDTNPIPIGSTCPNPFLRT